MTINRQVLLSVFTFLFGFLFLFYTEISIYHASLSHIWLLISISTVAYFGWWFISYRAIKNFIHLTNLSDKLHVEAERININEGFDHMGPKSGFYYFSSSLLVGLNYLAFVGTLLIEHCGGTASDTAVGTATIKIPFITVSLTVNY